MVDVARLLKAAEALAWRAGAVIGTAVRHRVEADGSHVITITVPAVLVDETKLPSKPAPAGKLSWGPSKPDLKRGGS